jgi:hypothetical protein
MAISYNPRIVTDGLVLALDAGNPKSYPGSGTTWTDLSGQGNNGTITGAVYTNGSFDFDGVNDDIVNTGTSFLKTNDNVTLEVFFNHDDGSTGFMLYEGEGDGFGGNVEFHLYVNGNVLNSWFTTSSGDFNLTGSSMTAGTWNYGAVTYENLSSVGNASSKLYQNGVLVDSGSSATVDLASMPISNFLIGRPYSTSLGRRYNGQIAVVRVYNRALTAQEIQQNFNATRSRFSI